MDQIFHYYDQFLKLFPDNWHTAVSVAIIILMVYLIIHFLRYGVIGIVLLVIFVPASIPVLKDIGLGVLAFVQHILK